MNPYKVFTDPVSRVMITLVFIFIVGIWGYVVWLIFSTDLTMEQLVNQSTISEPMRSTAIPESGLMITLQRVDVRSA
jgi:hypothetical protein